MGITFAVDDVTAVRERLATVPLEETVRETLGVEIHRVSHAADLVAEQRALHPLLQAVHVAFAQHRPLVLSPDHVWLTMAQGFATHLDRVGESLRTRFVRHDGKKELKVEVLEIPKTPEAWGHVVGAFGDRIAEHVGPGVKRLLECSFTTTTAVEQVASGVVMMSAFKRYFDFIMVCICGIPEVTLEGTAEDWLEIRRRLDVLAEYDLGWWAASLAPVLDELVRTAQGAPDRDFWQCIYKPVEAYGGEIATGWIMRLFPYLATERNPTHTEGTNERGRERWIREGLPPNSVPMAWSDARVKTMMPDGTQGSFVLYGGFAGVRQLPDGALRPEVTWAVGVMPEMTRILDTIALHHAPGGKTPPRGDDDPFLELPAELIELYERMDGATLFGGRFEIPHRRELWTLVGSVERGFEGIDPREDPKRGYGPATTIPVVPLCHIAGDPRFIGLYEHGPVILCDPHAPLDPEQIPVVALSVKDFLLRLLEHEGRLWFDEQPSGVMLYPHLSRHHDYLRRALEAPQSEIPTLSVREQHRVVFRLWWNEVHSTAHREYLWAALKAATGTEKTFEEVFDRNGRVPMHAFNDLGL